MNERPRDDDDPGNRPTRCAGVEGTDGSLSLPSGPGQSSGLEPPDDPGMAERRERTSLLFYRSLLHPCPYLPGRFERRVLTDLADLPDPTPAFGHLTSAGFRRSLSIAYRPVCPTCTACVPVRIPVGRFQPSTTQRRLVRRNVDLSVALEASIATDEQYALFQHYQASRHAGGDMATMAMSDYRSMVEDSPVDTALLTLRTQTGALVAVCLVDRSDDGLSAVYSFFDCQDPSRSLGAHLILALVNVCRASGLDYVYLGYWIEGSAKMQYKSRYRPLQRLDDDGWVDL